jgi:division/cell wall cluster transcriptional repressor MraZ
MTNYFNERSLHTIDGKGRLLLPRDIRGTFKIKKGDLLHLVPNLADPPYVEIRTEAEWKGYCESLRHQQSGEKKKDTFRYAMMLMETAKVDGQGRILVPQRIREMCRLDKTVAVINMGLYFEVWCKDHIAKRYADMVRAFKETNDRMF